MSDHQGPTYEDASDRESPTGDASNRDGPTYGRYIGPSTPDGLVLNRSTPSAPRSRCI